MLSNQMETGQEFAIAVNSPFYESAAGRYGREQNPHDTGIHTCISHAEDH